MSDTSQHGIVANAELCAPLEGAQVVRTHASGDVVEKVYTDEQGRWRIGRLSQGETVHFSLKGFVPKAFSGEPVPEVVRLLEDRLIGYQKRLWFVPGELVQVHVHSPESFSARLCRHGLVKEAVLHLGDFESHRQTLPDGFFVEIGLDWATSFAYTMPAEAKPGLYSLLLESTGQESFAIPMVVSTPEREYGKRARLLVLASTNTWQSYNIWGGRSRYRNFEIGSSTDFINPFSWKDKWRRTAAQCLPAAIKEIIKRLLRHCSEPPVWQFDRLSIRRPFTNCYLEEASPSQPFTNHLAAGEWRLLAWLEREKIRYDIVSGAELHKNPHLLQHYDAVLFSTHCEYWSRDMYEGLKFYHENKGLWILNVAGNTLFREIVFFEDGSTRCVSLSFARSCADETQILGVRFTEDDYGTCAPFKILLPKHWAFRDVACKNQGGIFGDTSLNQNTPKTGSRYDPGHPGLEKGLSGVGASGWEMDKFSDTAPRDIKIIAKGLNEKGGADMVVREPSGSRGGMFSASSVTFSGCLLIDNAASTLVKNVVSAALA